ncbi:SUKH-4 family immunity protein [Nonomuraea sp. NPDC050404]|uniref:SUKH-4 family immunity protein n=1 Tax=Nonomuraea sp. NPDC050404 TaxID=3155783 RepID=UPI003402F64B
MGHRTVISREELAAAFGEEALRPMDARRCRDLGLSEQDTRLLCEIGLPVRADQAFTTAVAGEPGTGSQVVFKTGSGDVDVLVLGGTAGGAGMRYFLDIRGGVVGLLSLDGEPQAERVNGSLALFVEFLYRLRLRQQALNGESEESARRHTEELWRSLRDLDPAAFGNAESWWSMVLDNLMDRDLIAETRAFLQQRRAETAGSPPAGAEPPVPAAQTQRAGFDQALARLEEDGWHLADAHRFNSDTATSGLLHHPADLDAYFTPDGTLVKDVTLAWRGGLPSRLQSVFAREGLVISVPGQAADQDDDYDELLGLDAEELKRRADEAMERLYAAVHNPGLPPEGTVTCLATDHPSDLCRIVRAFDRLSALHGYVAEPDLWPTASGGWQEAYDATEAGEPVRAVFWTTQQHTSSFDARGDLVAELALQWAGDPSAIAQELTTTGLEVVTPEDQGTAFLLRPRLASAGEGKS